MNVKNKSKRNQRKIKKQIKEAELRLNKLLMIKINELKADEQQLAAIDSEIDKIGYRKYIGIQQDRLRMIKNYDD
jgi:hypothetical protein